MLTSGRSIGFFIAIYWTVFYSLGFIIFFSLYSIFHKLIFHFINVVRRLVFLDILYSCIGPKFYIGSAVSFLLTFLIFSAGSTA